MLANLCIDAIGLLSILSTLAFISERDRRFGQFARYHGFLGLPIMAGEPNNHLPFVFAAGPDELGHIFLRLARCVGERSGKRRQYRLPLDLLRANFVVHGLVKASSTCVHCVGTRLE
jgi:hypothetical protein